MRRRHRSGGRIMLRGKPGLIVLVVVLLVGTLVAYYTWGGSSKTATKTRFSKYGSKSKYPGVQRPLSMGQRFGSQQLQKGPQVQNPPMNNKFLRDPMKPLQAPRNFDFQDGPKQDVDEDYKFAGDGDDDELEKSREEFKEGDDFVKSDSKPKDDLKEKKFQQSDEKTTASGILYPQLYVSPDPKLSEQFRKMEHIVHLDLKGAPPNIDYLISLLPLIKKLGATGLLVEYEDMFPYNGDLQILAANNAYKVSDIIRLLNAAKMDGLKVIPLVQTFGHMEFVLKYPKYLDLREDPDTPQVITPSSLKSYELIQKMIDQVMTLHSDAPFLHIGCDEVYGLGKGKVMDMMKAENISKEQVFLKHVKKVASSFKAKYPKTKVIMWDDELRLKVSAADIEKYELGSLVELMVWCYVPHPKDRLPASIWPKYGKHFSGIWAASSFKGATGSAQFFTNVSYHLENHISWVQIVKDIQDVIPLEKFRGFALTGWQRYDHFAALCELLPSSVPSLAVSLQVVQNGGFNPDIHKTVGKLLNCTKLVELDFPKKTKNETVISHDCRFPGSDFYYAVQALWVTKDKFNSDLGLQSRIQGWLTDYHIKTHFSSPGHMKILQKKLVKILDSLQSMVEPIRKQLKVMYDDNTVEEWIMVHLTQKIDELKMKLNMATVLLQGSKTWDKRPLVPKTSGLPMQSTFNQQQQQSQLQQQQQQQNLQQRQQGYGGQMNNGLGGQMNNGLGFKQGFIVGQQNNPLPQGMFGQQKNTQYNPANPGQSQYQSQQGVQNNQLSRVFQQGSLGMYKPRNSFGQQGGSNLKPTGLQNVGNQGTAMQKAGMWNDGAQKAGMQKPGMWNDGVQKSGMQNAGMWKDGLQKPGMQKPGMWNDGAQKAGMQNGFAGQSQSTYNQNAPERNQLSASGQQRKPSVDVAFQPNKDAPGMNADTNLLGYKRDDSKSQGLGAGTWKNALAVGKKTDVNTFIERSKDYSEKLKQKDDAQKFGEKKVEFKDLQDKEDSKKRKSDSEFDIPGRGLRRGDFKSLVQAKKGLKDSEYDEAEDRDGQKN